MARRVWLHVNWTLENEMLSDVYPQRSPSLTALDGRSLWPARCPLRPELAALSARSESYVASGHRLSDVN
jgi:hypothetical protein